ncbi:Alkali-sensitive linkage protein 1 [Erysiphe neolycopersici]|uniref:Alkali-sensitive linkage protein 1 n=1 Tax=Erysiphe neolycopersici TaxID=212602 RepID=A0A420I880_9PEZI|nr:Alkali-sensitive linkage protein 1 [Erysiphe neolycopersici]
MSIALLKKLAFSALSISLIQAAAVNRYELQKRQTYEVQENVVVVEQVDVTENPDGSFATALPKPVATSLSIGSPKPINDFQQTTPQLNIAASSTSIQNEQPGEQPEDQPEEDPEEEPEEDPEEQHGELPDEEPEVEPIVTDPAPSPEAKITSATTEQLPASEILSSAQSQAESNSAVPSNETPVTSNAPTSDSTNLSSKVAASSKAKRGIAYNDVTKLSAFTSSAKVSWAYNWGSTTPNIPGNIEYVPMLWGTGAHADKWTENANRAIASGSTHILAFNEPDLGSQSSLTVAEAVAGYQQLMQPYAGKAKLGSPAVTNGASPMGLAYLKNFIAACSGCTIDFVAIHWYNGGNADDFKNYVAKAHAVSGGRPVWITEFEGSGDAAQQQAFLNDVLPWLDSQDYVERYAYFMASDGNLISSGTTLSSVGQAFAYGN